MSLLKKTKDTLSSIFLEDKRPTYLHEIWSLDKKGNKNDLVFSGSFHEKTMIKSNAPDFLSHFCDKYFREKGQNPTTLYQYFITKE